VAYIRSTGGKADEGRQPVKLTFTSPGLNGVTLQLPY
jgi:hypothetical protein